jgi:ABC-type branched-subunit amino acid transport system substrate-binding protein
MLIADVLPVSRRVVPMPRLFRLGFALAFPIVAGCAPAPDAPRQFRIGLIGVFTGAWEASSGRPGLLGACLAVDELNKAGGVVIRGVPHRVVLVEKRIEPRPTEAATAARELINLDSVDVIVGPQPSALAIPAGAVAEVSQVPLRAARPDVLLLPNFLATDSLQIRALRRLGYRGRLLGTDTWVAIALMLRPDAEGAVIVANWDRRRERPGLQRFLAAWEAVHDEPPRATAAATHDAVALLAAAATRADTTSDPALMSAFRSAGEVDGALTRYRFDGTADPRRGAVVLRIDRDSTHVVALTGPRVP